MIYIIRDLARISDCFEDLAVDWAAMPYMWLFLIVLKLAEIHVFCICYVR